MLPLPVTTDTKKFWDGVKYFRIKNRSRNICIGLISLIPLLILSINFIRENYLITIVFIVICFLISFIVNFQSFDGFTTREKINYFYSYLAITRVEDDEYLRGMRMEKFLKFFDLVFNF